MGEETDQKHAYIIKRDFRSSMRLNYNHWLLTSLAGHLLHPSIPTGDGDVCIADVGTGTGIWAMEVAAKLPKAKIDGFDISSTQFPVPYGVPNVKFHTLDCFKPFPPELLGKYDIVHARYWLCLVNNPDASPLLANIKTLLKPGGYIQWSEMQALKAQVVKPDPSMPTPATDRMVTLFRKPQPTTSYEWTERLDEIFRENQLEVMATQNILMTNTHRASWGLSLLAGMNDLIAELKFVGPERADAMHGLSMEVEEEFKKGVGMDAPVICIIGKNS